MKTITTGNKSMAPEQPRVSAQKRSNPTSWDRFLAWVTSGKTTCRCGLTAALVIPTLLTAACGTRLHGKYYSSKQQIEFKSGNKANVRNLATTVGGLFDVPEGPTLEVDYEVRGKEVTIKSPQGTMVATIADDGCLDFGGALEKLCPEVSAGSGPGSALLAFFDALKRGDAISAVRFVPSSDSAEFMSQFPDMIRKDHSQPPRTVKILREDVTGDRAEVTVQGSGRGGVDTAIFALIHTDGRWTIDKTAHPKLPHDKEIAYVAAMKSDLRNLATYEEQYAADNNGAYFAGTATMTSPLQGFRPSQNVTITATIAAGPPQSWSASAVHSQSAKTCNNSTGVIVCT